MKLLNKTLEDISEVIAGQSPPSSTYNNLGNGVPFFQGMADFGEKHPKVRFYCTQPTKISNPNDILISVRAPVGPVIINNVKACIGRGLGIIRLNKNISLDYVYYYLKVNEKRISDLGVGSTFKAITQKNLKKVEIVIPENLTDQIRIAEILSQAEALIAQRKQSISLLDELLKSTFLEMFGDPVKNEKGLKKVKLVDITTKITDGKHGDCNDEENSGYYFLSAKDLINGELKYHNVREITQADFIEVHKRTALKLNDILLGNTGASIGKIGIVKDEEKASKTVFQKSISIISVKNEIILPHYLKAYLDYNRSIFNATSTGSAMPNLLLSQIRAFDIIVPSIKLQNEFIRIVEKVEALKTQYQQSLTELQNMYGVLSQKAFKGELNIKEIKIKVKV